MHMVTQMLRAHLIKIMSRPPRKMPESETGPAHSSPLAPHSTNGPPVEWARASAARWQERFYDDQARTQTKTN
jgi:hypothetical protein